MSKKTVLKHRAFGVVLLLALVAAVCISPSGAESAKRAVILISIDGMASYYLDDPMADLPAIRRMARQGASAERLNVSFPSSTWTSHTTLATGAYPRKHGVIANSILDRKTLKPVRYIGDSVYTKDEAVKAQTVYDAAHAAGLKTGAVIWPAVLGATTLDWLTPDVGTEDLILRHTTPELNRNLGAPIGNPIAEISKWRWGAAPGPFRDRKYSELAAYLLTEKKADLVLLHLVCPDSFQHKHAPKSPVAYWAINYIDSRIRYISSQLRRAGRLDRTTFILAGDHGFETVTHQIHPNVLLKKEGLLTMEGSSIQKGSDAYALSHGGSASVYILEEANKAQTAERLKEMFLQVDGVREVLDGSDLHRLGLPTPEENPEQGDLMLIPEEHYAFSGGVDGSDVVIGGQHSGTHGYLPSHPRMGSIFVAWGSGIKKGVKLKSAEAVDIAPTIAALLGIEMENPDGRILTEILE